MVDKHELTPVEQRENEIRKEENEAIRVFLYRKSQDRTLGQLTAPLSTAAAMFLDELQAMWRSSPSELSERLRESERERSRQWNEWAKATGQDCPKNAAAEIAALRDANQRAGR